MVVRARVNKTADAVILEHRDHGDRVGRRDQDAEQQGRRHRPGQPVHQPRRHDRGGDDGANNRQNQNGKHVAPQLAPVNVDRGLEQKRRKNDAENQVVGENQAGIDPRQRQSDTGDDETDGIG